MQTTTRELYGLRISIEAAPETTARFARWRLIQFFLPRALFRLVSPWQLFYGTDVFVNDVPVGKSLLLLSAGIYALLR